MSDSTPVSLSPKGDTLPNAKRRLDEIVDPNQQAKDPEHIMMGLWALANTRDSSLNLGLVPLDTILHQCDERCGSFQAQVQGVGASRHFYDGKLNEHDVQVMAATVQWMATNVGRAFYDKFSKALSAAHRPEPTT